MFWLGVFVVNWFIQSSIGQDAIMCATNTLEALRPGKGEIKSMQYPNEYPAGDSCVLTILACPYCNVTLHFKELSLPACYSQIPKQATCIRGCDHLYMQDDSYPEKSIKVVMHGDQFKSLYSFSRKVTIKFCSSKRNQYVKFRLQYEVKEKLVANEESLYSPRMGYISSPIFPERYIGHGDVYRYSFKALPGKVIRLTFDDWSMSANSVVRIYYGSSDSGTAVMTKFGTESRPFILTTGRNLFIQFENTPHDMMPTYWGIKAKYEYLTNTGSITKPTFDFGRYFYNAKGGVLSIPAYECWNTKLVDTLWVAKTFNKYMYEYMSLRITNNIDIEDIELREGTNSETGLLRKYRYGTEEVVRLGFYLRIRTQCTADIAFEAVYSLFTNASVVYDSPTGERS